MEPNLWCDRPRSSIDCISEVRLCCSKIDISLNINTMRIKLLVYVVQPQNYLLKLHIFFFQIIFHLRNPEQAYYHLNRHSGIYKIGKVEDTMTVYEFHFILFRCSLTINVYYIWLYNTILQIVSVMAFVVLNKSFTTRQHFNLFQFTNT